MPNLNVCKFKFLTFHWTACMSQQTTYGCCPDGQTPAGGRNNKDCPKQYGCQNTLYGCCPDGVSPAAGYEQQGCDKIVRQPCAHTEHGCCKDGLTPARGKLDDVSQAIYCMFCTVMQDNQNTRWIES